MTLGEIGGMSTRLALSCAPPCVVFIYSLALNYVFYLIYFKYEVGDDGRLC
jgi:hypothetical protein